MKRIGAHLHFWRYRAADFGWIEPGGVLARDWLPDDVASALDAAGFDGCIAVQAQHSEAETDWLLALARTIAAIAACPTVVCKLSGLVTEADHGAWHADDIARYLDHLLACFGPDRLMFGSDWPVCQLAADHARVVDLIEAFAAQACPGHRDAIFGGTARRVYARAGFAEDGR